MLEMRPKALTAAKLPELMILHGDIVDAARPMLFSKGWPLEFMVLGTILAPTYLPINVIAPREEVKPLVKGIPGNIHQGFDHCREAKRAYVLTFAMGPLHVLPARHDIGHQEVPAPAMPMPEAVTATFVSSSDNFLGADWYVVFKGKKPGVYPMW